MASTITRPIIQQNGQNQLAMRLFPTQVQSSRQASVSPSMSQQLADHANHQRASRPAIPRHPIPSMQEAFAESLAEVTSDIHAMKPRICVDNAQIRRDRLLDQEKSEPAPAVLWRYRPGQNCHELRKLLSQIAFGVYLLLKGMANSNAQVVAILQGHIDEVDDFLKTAMEDLQLATQDLNTRLDYLKLPLGNLPAFEEMLEDRDFRLRIVEGNVRIGHILSRTSTSLSQTVHDVEEGLRATNEFMSYLAAEEYSSWRVERFEVTDIYDTMRGNAEGWLNAFVDLEEKCNTLELLISKLSDMVTEMDRCAGDVSRRTRFNIKPFTLPELVSRSSEDSQISFRTTQETTPPQSPGIPVSPVAPRISLRFSALGDDISNLLDLDSKSNALRTSNGSLRLSSFQQYTPPADSPKEMELKQVGRNSVALGLDQALANGASPSLQSATVTETGDQAVDHGVSVTQIQTPDSLVPVGGPDTALPTEKADGTEGAPGDDAQGTTEHAVAQNSLPQYILQPRTYTPQPPTPLPSPRVDDEGNPRSRDERFTPQDSNPPLEALGNPDFALQVDEQQVQPLLTAVDRAMAEESISANKRLSMPSRAVSTSSGKTAGSNGMLSKKTSIRERVSLRTTPPQSIQVPPPDALKLQRPGFATPHSYQNYETFTGPDSTHSSDANRVVHGVHYHEPRSSNGGMNDNTNFCPPNFPAMIPSPHSDQQYFRPVLASPHSPLQQRPHTAGQLPSRNYHLRNAPSSMGMSMLSSVTTMTQDSKGQAVPKKKRSALGWLRKAFTLDEDERIAFDQRRQGGGRNLYYDNRSPRYLDGRRVR